MANTPRGIPLLVIPVLVSLFLFGCNAVPMSEPASSEYQQQIEDLEQQIQLLTKQVDSLKENSQKSVAEAPRIYESNIPDIATIPEPGRSWLFRTSPNYLKFEVETGNRVEGEVIINEYHLETDAFTGNSYGISHGFVIDPYRNVIVQDGFLVKNYLGNIILYPTGGRSPGHWQFAFIAANTGEYEVNAFIECTAHEYVTNPPPVVGTIKVTVYNE